MTEQTEQKVEYPGEGIVRLDPPISMTPAQATRLIIELDPVRPSNTLIKVQQDGEWRPVGRIMAFQFYVDALGANRTMATFATKPENMTDELWAKHEASIEKSKKLLQDVGVEVK